MQKKALTEYGKRVKSRLIDLNMTQEWLVSEIKKQMPDSYVDSSLLNKIFVGEVEKSKIIPTINRILQIDTAD
ncbi:MAG: XRE family transcriptional regulator [Ruminococcus sp.]|uniref:XRE family transcriptional regulator n=1 Tax=Ruminococcus sp. TaxID=41978 RepID=UPI002873BE0F|nr:XRE family transcriptional regulator [Ruminococcus sp.]MBQ3285436.1 XRE family transcriptional regulator [Ruminococcus sp.]